MRKLRHVIGSIFLGTGLGLIVFVAATSQSLWGARFGAYVVLSGSMEPALPVGSVVITRSQPTYSPGDIVTFRAGDSVVTHRLIEVGERLVTKGDANEEPDRLSATPGDVLGRTVLSIPYFGYFVSFVKTPKGFVAMVVIPASLVVYEELKTIARQIRAFARRRWLPRANMWESVSLKKLVIVPLFGVVALGVGMTGSFLTDTEESRNNIIGVANDFEDNGGSETEPERVVINEVLYDPSSEQIGQGGSEGAFEWVELYNAGDDSVNLKNWTVSDNNDSDIITTEDFFLAPGAFVVIGNSLDIATLWGLSEEGFIALGSNIGNGLANGGDRVILKNAADELLDQVSYGSNTSALDPPVPIVSEGHSIERVPVGADTDINTDFVDRIPPTPGL